MSKSNLLTTGYGFLAFLILGFSSVGCTMHSVPDSIPMQPDMISAFQTSSSISVENNQPSEDEVLIIKKHGDDYMANYRVWTNSVVRLLSEELTKRGAIVSDRSDKQLQLAVTDAKVVDLAARYRCHLTVQVITGEGDSNDFEVENVGSGFRTPDMINRACGGAVTRAVATILNDDEIREYLQGE